MRFETQAKVIISDMKGGGIKEVKTVWVVEGVSFEIPHRYTDLKIKGRHRLRRMKGRGEPELKLMMCSAIDTESKSSSSSMVMIKKVSQVMENYRVSWSFIREICFFRHTKPKFLHFFIDLRDIIIPVERDLFDSRIQDVYMVYELDEKYLTLKKFIQDTKANLYSQKIKHQKTILSQLLLILYYLQSRKIEHRELTSSNVIVRNEFKLQLYSLGSSCHIRTTESSTGTPNLEQQVDALVLKKEVKALRYRPPEAILGCSSSSSNRGGGTYDMWSIGCLFGEVLCHEPLFTGDRDDMEKLLEDQLDSIADILGDPTPEDVDFIKDTDNEAATSFKASVLKKTADGLNFLPFPFDEVIEGGDPVALDLLSKMLKYNPNNRIRVEDALQHEFVRDFIANDPLLQGWLDDIKQEDGKQKPNKVDDDDEEQHTVTDHDFIRKKLLREKFLFYNRPRRIFLMSQA